MIGDPFLNYFALGLLIFVVVVLFYGIIAIHDIPYMIAEKREHPHQDAIHAAGWVSLFTLHALWPFLWIWAMAYRPERGWGFHHLGPKPDAVSEAQDAPSAAAGSEVEELPRAAAAASEVEELRRAATAASTELKDLRQRIAQLENNLKAGVR